MKISNATLCVLGMLTTLPSFAANHFEVVTMQNATSCHVDAKGHYSVGRSVSVGTFSEPFNEYSIIYPSETGNMPVLKDQNNAQLYAIVDNGNAADEWKVNYVPGNQYILSYDAATDGCDPQVYQCLVFSNFNPCS